MWPHMGAGFDGNNTVSDLFGGSIFGHSLGALRDGVLGEFTGEE